ncbi:MAG: tetratricopeptide repeat protein [Deltaproteobacteria bacterium]|nr:tetratricopeptide repeat protein [Deltaproteobacteria bacterium]
MPDSFDDPEVLFDGAVAAHESGDLASAERLYRRVIAIDGEDAVALELLGAVLRDLGRIAESLAMLDRSLLLDGSSPTAWLHRGETRLRAGDADGAESDLRRCLSFESTRRDAALRLAIMVAESGRPDEAIELLAPWLAESPPPLEVAIARSRVLLELGRHEEVLQSLPASSDPSAQTLIEAIRLESSLRRSPSTQALLDSPLPDGEASEAVGRAAVALARLGRIDDGAGACVCLRQARAAAPDPLPRVLSAIARRSPELAEPFRSSFERQFLGEAAESARLGLRAMRAGDLDQAARHLASAVVLRPDLPELACTLASLLLKAGRAESALAITDAALDRSPDHAGLHHARGSALIHRHRYAEGEAALRQAIRIRPDQHESTGVLTELCLTGGRLGEAIALGRSIPVGLPASAGATAVVAEAMALSMRQSEAISMLRESAEREPGLPFLQSQILYLLNFPDDLPDELIVAEHRRRAAMIAPTGDPPRSAAERRDALASILALDRRIRVGILSPDLRRHSVWFFLEPLLSALDRRRFEVIGLSDVTLIDEVTDRLQRLCDGWMPVAGLDDDRLGERIRAAGIDLLIELTGHTGRGRLAAIARRVAPVQASYLGYPNTTGVGSIDFRIVDGRTDPRGTESLASESLLRMPRCFLCHMPDPQTPPLEVHRPARPPTFGCFNSLAKVTPTTLRAFAAALLEVPGSRLLMKSKSLRDDSVAARLTAMLVEQGIDPTRVLLRSWETRPLAHLATYADVDVALDTYPYHGTTTTCEALSMGVPVITLAGRAHRSRVGVSLLSSIGREDLVANDVPSFARAAALAVEEAGRPRRDLLEGTPLRDPRGFAADFLGMLEAGVDDASPDDR